MKPSNSSNSSDCIKCLTGSVMRKKSIKIQAGPRRRKRVVFASTRQVDRLSHVAERFMAEVFELDRGDYAISDESNLLDFADFDSSDTSAIWSRIDQLYAFTKDEVRSENLVDIFAVLATRKSWN